MVLKPGSRLLCISRTVKLAVPPSLLTLVPDVILPRSFTVPTPSVIYPPTPPLPSSSPFSSSFHFTTRTHSIYSYAYSEWLSPSSLNAPAPPGETQAWAGRGGGGGQIATMTSLLFTEQSYRDISAALREAVPPSGLLQNRASLSVFCHDPPDIVWETEKAFFTYR